MSGVLCNFFACSPKQPNRGQLKKGSARSTTVVVTKETTARNSGTELVIVNMPTLSYCAETLNTCWITLNFGKLVDVLYGSGVRKQNKTKRKIAGQQAERKVTFCFVSLFDEYNTTLRKKKKKKKKEGSNANTYLQNSAFMAFIFSGRLIST